MECDYSKSDVPGFGMTKCLSTLLSVVTFSTGSEERPTSNNVLLLPRRRGLLLREEPCPQLRVVVGFHPTVVADAGILGVFYLAAGLVDRRCEFAREVR